MRFFWLYISGNTEITAINAFWPRRSARAHPIDPVAFFVALIGAPVLVALVGFPVLFIPVFALGFGGLPFLLIGGPILALALSRGITKPGDLATIGAITMLVLTVALMILFVISRIIHGADAVSGYETQILFFGSFAVVFAAIWAAVFGTLYARFRKPLTPSAH